MNNETKISFLTNAISDAQELIRFTDNKTAVAITILGAYVVAFFTAIEKIVKYSCDYSFFFWLFFSVFLVLLVLCILITTRIIKPTNNPIDNINLGNLQEPNLKFFLTPNDYANDNFYPYYNSKKFRLKEIYETYSQRLNSSNENDIINSLTFELLKVSYIRNIKNDRFHILLWLLVGTTISFFIFYFFFSIETQNIIDFIESCLCECCKK